MATLKLVADPEFKAKVPIPVPGREPVPVEFTFRHRTRSQLDAFLKPNGAPKNDLDMAMDCVTGWDLEEPFTRENVAVFLDNYHGAAVALSGTYVSELLGARLGNSAPPSAPSTADRRLTRPVN